MSFVCQNCGKKTAHGIAKRHKRGVAGKRWKKRAPKTKRLFKPNLQYFNGRRLCAKCIKKIKKEKSLGKLQ